MPPSIQRRQASINRCNIPPWILASQDFQDKPQPLEITGAKQTDRRLFDKLNAIADPAERGRIFHEYISVKFRLHEWNLHEKSARASLRHSYIQCIHGWGADSNGHAGAVMKSWAESRFGLIPTYHGGRLDCDEEAREKFVIDRMKGASRTIGATMQLDLLYTFCQDELQRRWPGKSHLTLYRGTHDPENYSVIEVLDKGSMIVELNNLSSFSADQEVAWEFGSEVWEVRIPFEKIMFFSGLLPPHLLGGESEYIVLGGLYKVRRMLY
jgi:NAD+--dinitrogen-reductase ADP-D-ribosyltransferase